ncbi:MAG TPA: ATP-binding protein [Candidatus Avimuribaculum pullicola]|nr:ATP-binding protein [Candidatus Avimuribaculum pullicola]
MIDRELYMGKIRPFIDRPVIKVIAGIRRCGKSVVLQLIKEELERRGVPKKRIIYMNFESFEWMDIVDAKSLYLYIKKRVEMVGDKVYILLDEVQEVQGWEKAVDSFMVDWDVDVYVTGSNSRLLSSELSTYIAGRYVSFRIMPLSFGEYLLFHNVANADKDVLRGEFLKYIRMGGFPAVHTGNYSYDSIYKLVYDIYSSVILRDTVQRHGIRNVELLERVVRFVFDNIGNRLNAKNIADYFKSQQRKVDINTIYNYMNALQGAFILQRVPRYDIIGKERLQTNEKYFVSDLSLIYAVMGYKDRMISGALENIVYWEMVRRGYDTYIGKYNNREVDFVGVQGNEKIYVQVTYRMESDATVEREFAPLLSIGDNYPKFVVSMDDVWQDNIEGVKHRHIADFLIDRSWGLID